MSKVINRDDIVDLTAEDDKAFYTFEPIDPFQHDRKVKEAHDKGWCEGITHSMVHFKDLPVLHRLWIALTGNLFE